MRAFGGWAVAERGRVLRLPTTYDANAGIGVEDLVAQAVAGLDTLVRRRSI